MLELVIPLILFSIGCSVPYGETFWYEQKLDHYDPTDTTTFQQKYMVYDGYLDRSKDTIFFYAGNEGAIENFYRHTGFMFDIASDFGALILFCEQRYYGKSKPFGNDMSVDNLAYLTNEHTVADYAKFMRDMKIKYDMSNATVIVFGGSQGGILAALCRIHFPNIFDMALASSAPIPQVMNEINGTTFFKLVTNVYEKHNSKCPHIVRKGYAQLIEASKNNEWDLIAKTFDLCQGTEINDNNGLTYLTQWSRNAYLTMAMVNYPYAGNFLGSLPAWPVNVACDILVENEKNPMTALAKSAGFYYNASSNYKLKCYDIYEEYQWCADQTGCPGGDNFYPWDFQMCTEIVYAQITNNISDMFPPSNWSMGQLKEYCKQQYDLTPMVEWMKLWFPLNFAHITDKIIFSNGLMDPWHGGGYLTPPGGNSELPVVIIPSGAHHLDLRGSNSADPQDVIDAREKEVQILKNWMAGKSADGSSSNSDKKSKVSNPSAHVIHEHIHQYEKRQVYSDEQNKNDNPLFFGSSDLILVACFGFIVLCCGGIGIFIGKRIPQRKQKYLTDL